MRNVHKCGVALLSAALLISGCGGSSQSASSSGSQDEPVTLTWWHNATDEPLKGYWQSLADSYTAAHPNVTFTIEPVQNESIATKISVGLQSNDPPDIYQQWGGGDLATQVEAGKVQDVTASTSAVIDKLGGSAAGWQVDGKQYGVPYSLGIVGFWYRTDLFEQAGITATPTTIEELYSAIDKLEAAGIAPIAVGSKDKWPDAFWWGYFATRNCTRETLQTATKDLVFTDPCFLKAGQDLDAFLAKEPFQDGFLGTPAQQGAASSAGLLATGKAAMELQGHWDGGVINGLTPDKTPLGDKLGWFPFPTVDGGAGAADAAFGGGDGFSCSAAAPPACADFLAFMLSPEEQKRFAALSVGPPILPGAETAVSDATLKSLIDFRNSSSFVQLYFDKALPTAVGEALNDEIANLFAGQSSPDQIVATVTDAAAQN
jgi:raffinose/stachyose/melibiose transport system substrate-binding protein